MLTARDIEAIYEATYREGEWYVPEKPLVQRELLDACWQSVLDAVRAESRAEVMRLTQKAKDLEAVVIAAMETQAA